MEPTYIQQAWRNEVLNPQKWFSSHGAVHISTKSTLTKMMYKYVKTHAKAIPTNKSHKVNTSTNSRAFELPKTKQICCTYTTPQMHPLLRYFVGKTIIFRSSSWNLLGGIPETVSLQIKYQSPNYVFIYL